VKIGITFSEANYANYPAWIKGDDAIEIIELSFEKNNIEELQNCYGIVLTGGVDIMPENTDYANAPKYFNPERDEFERKVFLKALDLKKPILGICRGLQVINVNLGGTLILDLGEIENEIHKRGLEDKIHQIFLDENSLLYDITKKTTGVVNSAHHQAVDYLGLGLKIVAKSQNGLVEAIELENPEDQFLLAVQWHPERMEDKNNPFTKNIREAFLDICSQKIL
jgi:putative glutamine amidotransferase